MSNRDSSDGYDDERTKHGEKTAKLVTADDLRRKVEDLKNGKGLDNVNIKFDTDEDGNTRIFGLKVSSSLAPTLRTAVAGLKALIIQHSDKVYNTSVHIAGRLGLKNAKANLVGAILEDTVRWGMVGADQIYNLAHASTEYRKERKELFSELEPVIQATGANYRNNEVIKAAFEDIHRGWVNDMKLMAADIPMMIATGVLAWQGQVDAQNRRKMNVGDDAALSQGIDAIIAAETKHVTKQVESNERLEKLLDEKRKQYIKDNRGRKKDYYGKSMSDQRIAQQFDETIGDRVRSNFEERQNAQFQTGKDLKKSDGKDAAFWVAVPALGLVGEAFKYSIEENVEKRRKHANGWKMIKHLQHEVERQCESKSRSGDGAGCEPKSPDEIMVSASGDKGGADLTLKQYIIEIFQQHERDRNPGKIFKDKKGNVINPLGESLVEQLEGPINQIAEAIASRRIDASALVILVGENKIIKHKGSERHFANKEEVAAAIDALAPVLNTQEKIKPQEFFANFVDPALAEGTLKKALETLKGDEKALFASLFPHEILERTGLKKKEIADLHKQAHEHLYNFVAVSILALAETAEKNPDQLKKSGLREEDLRNIADLAEKVRSDDIKALQTAVDGHNPVVNAVRTELLNSLATGNGMASWVDRVGKSKNFKLEEGQVAATATDREANRRGKETDVVVPGGPV